MKRILFHYDIIEQYLISFDLEVYIDITNYNLLLEWDIWLLLFICTEILINLKWKKLFFFIYIR